MNAKKQNHRQSREQMVDQNFANNTLFMTLSDIEAIEQKYLYTSSKPKQFGMYDPVDYSHREVDVLKEQLRLKLFLTNTSMQCFRQDYGTGQYRLPQSFNEEMVLQRLNGFQKTFQQKQDEDCFQMCEDLKKMMQGQSSGFYFETKQFKTAAAVSQKENTMGLINASSRMREEQAQFESKYRDGMQAHEIEFKHNQQFQKTPAVQVMKVHWRSGKYEGEVVGQVPHGKGKFVSQYGVLIGCWDNGQLNGEYQLTNKAGQRYKLIYDNGKQIKCEPIKISIQPQQKINPNGNINLLQQPIQNSIIEFEDGIYRGSRLGNVPHGPGRFESQSGVLTGTWINGKLEGQYFFSSRTGQNNLVRRELIQNGNIPHKANEVQNKHNPEQSQMINQKCDVKREGQVLNQQIIQKNQNNQNQQQNNPIPTKISWHNGQYYGELLGNVPHGSEKFQNHLGVLIGQWNHGILGGECIFKSKRDQVYRQIYENNQLKYQVRFQKGNQINTLTPSPNTQNPNIQQNNQNQNRPKTWYNKLFGFVFS